MHGRIALEHHAFDIRHGRAALSMAEAYGLRSMFLTFAVPSRHPITKAVPSRKYPSATVCGYPLALILVNAAQPGLLSKYLYFLLGHGWLSHSKYSLMLNTGSAKAVTSGSHRRNVRTRPVRCVRWALREFRRATVHVRTLGLPWVLVSRFACVDGVEPRASR